MNKSKLAINAIFGVAGLYALIDLNLFERFAYYKEIQLGWLVLALIYVLASMLCVNAYQTKKLNHIVIVLLTFIALTIITKSMALALSAVTSLVLLWLLHRSNQHQKQTQAFIESLEKETEDEPVVEEEETIEDYIEQLFDNDVSNIESEILAGNRLLLEEDFNQVPELPEEFIFEEEKESSEA